MCRRALGFRLQASGFGLWALGLAGKHEGDSRSAGLQACLPEGGKSRGTRQTTDGTLCAETGDGGAWTFLHQAHLR